MTKVNFNFAIQLVKFLFRTFTKVTKREMSLTEKLQIAISTGDVCTIEFVKEGNSELTERIATKLKRNKVGNVLFWDVQKESLRSFKPENLQQLEFIKS